MTFSVIFRVKVSFTLWWSTLAVKRSHSRIRLKDCLYECNVLLYICILIVSPGTPSSGPSDYRQYFSFLLESDTTDLVSYASVYHSGCPYIWGEPNMSTDTNYSWSLLNSFISNLEKCAKCASFFLGRVTWEPGKSRNKSIWYTLHKPRNTLTSLLLSGGFNLCLAFVVCHYNFSLFMRIASQR